MNKRWIKRPKHSTWGDWGEDDQLGRLNLLTPERVKQGVAEVKEGKTFCLSLPLDYPGGQVINKVRFPPVLKPVIRNNAPYFNYRWNRLNPNHTDIGSDDVVLLHTQYSTQWDSLAHRGALFDVMDNGKPQAVYYNGYAVDKDVVMDKNERTTAAHALGIEKMASHGVQGRGVLVDLYTEFGDFPRREIGYEDLMYVMNKQNVTVEEGDMLCLWTGLDLMILNGQGQPDPSITKACAVLDGSDEKLLQWIIDSGISIIASDNLAIEATGKSTNKEGTNLPIHKLCLFKLGIHLGELWLLCDLAKWLKKNNRNRFLLTAPPLRLTGAVGSPVTPIATV